nr:MAG TPA: hypothetical protein [Caudoviricetes sp.]
MYKHGSFIIFLELFINISEIQFSFLPAHF